MIERHEHKMKDPFTGEEPVYEIDITEQVEKAQFQALKNFITQHLKCSLDNEDLKANKFRFQQMEWLIVQLYQPNDHLTLINKLLKFSDHLFGIKEYNEVLDHLKCNPEKELTVGDVPGKWLI